jgi:hypothetical protein
VGADVTLEETRPTGAGRARGLVSSRESGRRVESRSFAPPPDLADVIAALWTGRWDLRDHAPHTTELLGDPCLHVVFEDGDRGPDARVVASGPASGAAPWRAAGACSG